MVAVADVFCVNAKITFLNDVDATGILAWCGIDNTGVVVRDDGRIENDLGPSATLRWWREILVSEKGLNSS